MTNRLEKFTWNEIDIGRPATDGRAGRTARAVIGNGTRVILKPRRAATAHPWTRFRDRVKVEQRENSVHVHGQSAWSGQKDFYTNNKPLFGQTDHGQMTITGWLQSTIAPPKHSRATGGFWTRVWKCPATESVVCRGTMPCGCRTWYARAAHEKW